MNNIGDRMEVYDAFPYRNQLVGRTDTINSTKKSAAVLMIEYTARLVQPHNARRAPKKLEVL